MTWKLVYTKQAQKDAKKLAASNLKKKAQALLDIRADDPFKTPLLTKNSWAIWLERTRGASTFNIASFIKYCHQSRLSK